MKRCTLCLIPDTRPDTPFDAEGVCSACRSYSKRKEIDWYTRKRDLEYVLKTHHDPSREFDCIVASSGGKDSHWQVRTLLDLGARPLIVTASTCHLTPIGRANIDNLARFATTIEVSPNKTVRARLNRAGLELVGDISWPEHVGIFTIPYKIACQQHIPLIFYGENPQEAYGGPMGTEEARIMTSRWVSEFGGFLGLRPSDLVGYGTPPITAHEMSDYMPPDLEPHTVGLPEAHFLGAYFPWDSNLNATVAMSMGMKAELPSHSNWWPAENLDNAQTGIHDHMMWRKYGYGRACAQLSVDIRMGLISRAQGIRAMLVIDGKFPGTYAGVPISAVLDRLDLGWNQFVGIMDKFTSWPIIEALQQEGNQAAQCLQRA